MRTKSRLALSLVGAGLALTGAILLIRAAWVGLALALGPAWAFAIVGGVLAATGGLMVALAGNAKRPAPPQSPQAAMMGAFFEGLRAGRATKSRRH